MWSKGLSLLMPALQLNQWWPLSSSGTRLKSASLFLSSGRVTLDVYKYIKTFCTDTYRQAKALQITCVIWNGHQALRWWVKCLFIVTSNYVVVVLLLWFVKLTAGLRENKRRTCPDLPRTAVGGAGGVSGVWGRERGDEEWGRGGGGDGRAFAHGGSRGRNAPPKQVWWELTAPEDGDFLTMAIKN